MAAGNFGSTQGKPRRALAITSAAAAICKLILLPSAKCRMLTISWLQREEEEEGGDTGDAWSALVFECSARLLKKEKRDLQAVPSKLATGSGGLLVLGKHTYVLQTPAPV